MEEHFVDRVDKLKMNRLVAAVAGIYVVDTIVEGEPVLVRCDGKLHYDENNPVMFSPDSDMNDAFDVLGRFERSGSMYHVDGCLVTSCKIVYKNIKDGYSYAYGDNNGGYKPIYAMYEAICRYVLHVEDLQVNDFLEDRSEADLF